MAAISYSKRQFEGGKVIRADMGWDGRLLEFPENAKKSDKVLSLMQNCLNTRNIEQKY